MTFKKISVDQTTHFGSKFICTKFGAVVAAGVKKIDKSAFRHYGNEWEKKFQNGADVDLGKNFQMSHR